VLAVAPTLQSRGLRVPAFVAFLGWVFGFKVVESALASELLDDAADVKVGRYNYHEKDSST